MRPLVAAAATAAALGLGIALLLCPVDEAELLPPQRAVTAIEVSSPSPPATFVVAQASANEAVAGQPAETAAAATSDEAGRLTASSTSEVAAEPGLATPDEPAESADDPLDPRLVAALDEVVEELLNEEDPTTLGVLSADLASNARSISVAGVTRLVTLARVGTEAQRTQAFVILAERAPTPSLTESVYKAYAENPNAKVRAPARAALARWVGQDGSAERYLASLKR